MLKVKQIIVLFLVWRVALLFLAYFGLGRFPIEQNFYSQNSVDFFRAFANWDGGHFIGIAENGYAHIFQYAFFPLYPLLIKGVSFLTGNFFLAAYLISHLSLLGSLIVFYKLVRLKYSHDIALRSVIYLLIFPSSVFLVSAYSESLFLTLAISSFYFGFTKKWGLACIFASLASATRFMGIFVIIGIFLEYLSQIKFDLSKIRRDIWWFLISPLGLFLYMYYLFIQVGDPLFFAHTQSYWHRSTNLISPLAVLESYSVILFYSIGQNPYIFAQKIIEYAATLLFLISSFFIFKKMGISLGTYVFLITLFPIFTGTLLAMPRYVLVGFPVFTLLAIWGQNPVVDTIIKIVSLTLLGIVTILFINGSWIA